MWLEQVRNVRISPLNIRFTQFPGVRNFPRGIGKIAQATEHEDVIRQVLMIDYQYVRSHSKLSWIIQIDILLVELLGWVTPQLEKISNDKVPTYSVFRRRHSIVL
jgi:hypothetical protein